MSTEFVPSEEFTLHCDIKGCEAQLSMVGGVPRSEHGWGRTTIYDLRPDPTTKDDSPIISGVPTFSKDYDLCAEHYRSIRALLEGEQ